MSQDDGGTTEVTQAVPAQSGRRGRGAHYRLRFWLAIVLVVLSVLAVIVSAVAVWAHRTVYDTDTYVATVAPLIKDPAVQHDVATTITQQAITASDLQTRIADVLPARASFLAGPITLEIQNFIQGELQQFLASPRAEQAWIAINRKGHEALVNILRGNSKYVTISRNEVTLNLLPLVGVALQELQARLPDVLGSRIQLPQIDPNATPDQARAQLSAALGRALPADFGTVVLLHGDQGHQIQRALDIFNKLLVVLIIVSVALVAAAIVVSPRRWWTTLELALGLLLGVVITKVVVDQLQRYLLDSIKKQGVADVASRIVTSAMGMLGGVLAWLIAGAVIVAVIAFVGSRPGWFEAAGRWLAKVFHLTSDPSAPPSAQARWLAGHLDLLRIGGVVVVVIALLVAPKTWGWMIGLVVALVAYELLVVVWGTREGVGREAAAGERDAK